jgi:hypothetical protein
MKTTLTIAFLACVALPGFAQTSQDKACKDHAKIAMHRAQIIKKAVALRAKTRGKDGIWRDALDTANNMIGAEEDALRKCTMPSK